MEDYCCECASYQWRFSGVVSLWCRDGGRRAEVKEYMPDVNVMMNYG
jgi:hypothetical protein